MNGRELVNFKEFSDQWMRFFFMEPASAENCDKMSKLVLAYFWDHPEFSKHREDVEAFWGKVGEAWTYLGDSYYEDPKPL
jgi:hypothetical protein